MSRIDLNLIWQHEKVLPYLLGELRQKIEAISPIENIYLYGSRARTPTQDWKNLDGKDWDILVVCKFPIINTKIWTTALNYHIDLKITDTAGTENFFKYKKHWVELYPKLRLKI